MSIGPMEIDLARLEAAVARLPQLQRAAFLLAARERLAYSDIGRRLGVSVRRVEKLIAKALTRLGRDLK